MAALQLLDPPAPAVASPRQAAQQRLVHLLTANAERWTAAPGVVAGLARMPNGGAVRVIHFGVRNRLAVRITIFSPTSIQVTALGEWAFIVEGRYQSVEAVEAALHRLLRDVP